MITEQFLISVLQASFLHLTCFDSAVDRNPSQMNLEYNQQILNEYLIAVGNLIKRFSATTAAHMTSDIEKKQILFVDRLSVVPTIIVCLLSKYAAEWKSSILQV